MKTELNLPATTNKQALSSIRRIVSLSELDIDKRVELIGRIVDERRSVKEVSLTWVSEALVDPVKEHFPVPANGSGKILSQVPISLVKAMLDRILNFRLGPNSNEEWWSRVRWRLNSEYGISDIPYIYKKPYTEYTLLPHSELMATMCYGLHLGKLKVRQEPGGGKRKTLDLVFNTKEYADAHPEYIWFDHLVKGYIGNYHIYQPQGYTRIEDL
jgi:hypothetical protein